MKCHETSVSSCVPISFHAFSCQLHGYVPTKNRFQCFPCFPYLLWAHYCIFLLFHVGFILVHIGFILSKHIFHVPYWFILFHIVCIWIPWFLRQGSVRACFHMKPIWILMNHDCFIWSNVVSYEFIWKKLNIYF